MNDKNEFQSSVHRQSCLRMFTAALLTVPQPDSSRAAVGGCVFSSLWSHPGWEQRWGPPTRGLFLKGDVIQNMILMMSHFARGKTLERM